MYIYIYTYIYIYIGSWFNFTSHQLFTVSRSVRTRVSGRQLRVLDASFSPNPMTWLQNAGNNTSSASQPSQKKWKKQVQIGPHYLPGELHQRKSGNSPVSAQLLNKRGQQESLPHEEPVLRGSWSKARARTTFPKRKVRFEFSQTWGIHGISRKFREILWSLVELNGNFNGITFDFH